MRIKTTNQGYSRFSPNNAIEVIDCLKSQVINHTLDKILTTNIDLDISDIEQSTLLEESKRNKYSWLGPFVFKIGNEFLFLQFDGYFCYQIGLNCFVPEKIIDVKNMPLENIMTTDKNIYIDISFLYPEIMGKKIIDIYVQKKLDDRYVSAIVLMTDNFYYIAIGNDDIDNPRMEIFSTKEEMEKTVCAWQ